MDTMSRRFLKILVRNVTFSAILTLIVINIDVISYNFTHDYRFRSGVLGGILIVSLGTCLVYLLKYASKNIKPPKLTTKPVWRRYLGWPQHSSIISALLIVWVVVYEGYTTTRPMVYLYDLLPFIAIYILLSVGSWIWINFISKKYKPPKRIWSDRFIRSQETYKMIRVCVCHKDLKGYMALRRFGIAGIWPFVIIIMPLVFISLFTEENGPASFIYLVLYACAFYLLQIIVRWGIYLQKGHGLGCALRRAYCEAI